MFSFLKHRSYVNMHIHRVCIVNDYLKLKDNRKMVHWAYSA